MIKYDFNSDWLFTNLDGIESKVNLPFDAMIYESRDSSNPTGSGCGFFRTGIYTFSKKFTCPLELLDKHTEIVFEGVYRNATVYINGFELGTHYYGYTQFTYSLDKYLNYGSVNEIVVKVDNSKAPNSRWYSGCGIYRPVYLVAGDKENYINYNGIKIETKSINPAVIEVISEGKKENSSIISYEIFDNDELIYSGPDSVITIPNAKLWSDKSPYLYTLKAYITKGDELLDTQDTTFGIRTIEYSSEGLFINGVNTLLKGGCIHHDNGILGAISVKEAEYRKISILKRNGFNAVRIAHNPASNYLLEACDNLGMYVLDEAFDMWYSGKNPYDYSLDFNNNYQTDIKAMCENDYNHPSVIMYSIGNEISDPVTEEGLKMANTLTILCHKYDKTRPVTAGINILNLLGAINFKDKRRDECNLIWNNSPKLFKSLKYYNKMILKLSDNMQSISNSKAADAISAPFSNAIDIVGYNYATTRYPNFLKNHPNRCVVGTETFAKNIYKDWEMVKKYPYVIGEFVWVAMDYIGETGLGAFAYEENSQVFARPYPGLLGDSGVLDILGNPNGEAGLFHVCYEALTNPEIYVKPIRLDDKIPAMAGWRFTNSIPSWSFRGCDNKMCEVEVYAKPGYVTLFLNGKKIKKSKVKEGRAIFNIIYKPGVLEAFSYDDDKKLLGTQKLISADSSLELRLIKEPNYVDNSIIYVDIDICGSNGSTESNVDCLLEASVTGGKLLGLGSAKHSTIDSFVSGKYHTHYGKAMAIVKKESNECVLTVSSDNYGCKNIIL